MALLAERMRMVVPLAGLLLLAHAEGRGPPGPGNEDVVPEVVLAAAGEPSASDPAADARQRREFDAAVRAIFGRRADGAPSRRGPRPR